MTYALCAAAGLVVGGVLAWAVATDRARRAAAGGMAEAERRAGLAEGRAAAIEGTAAELRDRCQRAGEETEKLRATLAAEHGARVRAETQLKELEQRLLEERKLLDDARTKLSETFKALAGDTLHANASAFLERAKETFDKVLAEARGDLGKRQEAIQGLVAPLTDSLKRFEEHVSGIEKARQDSYVGLTEQLKTLASGQHQLQQETANLVTALRRPQVRGRWGELTLQRVVELAGMTERCDFAQQVSVNTEGGRQRPDMVVYLPQDRQIVVDAKVPLEAYLDAIDADSEEARRQAMARHARHVRDHMNALADKRYWAQCEQTPDFVVMFIPGESFFGAAVDADPKIVEDGLELKVVLATPTTLLALLRAVAYGWRQQQIAKNAQEISAAGRDLYDRMKTLLDHIVKVGKGLKSATTAYNDAVGSIDARVLPAARRFKDLGAASGAELSDIPPVDIDPRKLNAPEHDEEE
ncbi:MAG TPA: DNA recombination protein RmuC [Candidatus Hydrogenedentes bacterium]|nr:DNA recombination protein RmuC [Candidatus Hydrogenedentota bacterium]